MIHEVTPEEKREALIHATVWEDVFHTCKYNADHRHDIDRGTMTALATFALIVGGAYRKVANSGRFEE